MKWLVWKDYRVNRPVFITALVLLIVPHVLAAILVWYGGGLREHRAHLHLGPPGVIPLSLAQQCFMMSSVCSLALLQLVFALLGGNSIAGERIDRSAEFLAYLPVSRGRILASKLLVALAAVPLVWLPNLAVLTIVGAFNEPVPVDATGPLGGLISLAVIGLTFFCVAWFLSCVLESPTFSACAGLIAPLLVAMGMGWATHLLRLTFGENAILFWYWGLCLAISASGFWAGTFHYLRRVEP
jgi:ABC-type transport system involved in multi-copper enzyme maturation permease subunit